jgi:hypothetical protein
MNTIEFNCALGAEGQIQIPHGLVERLPAGIPFHVVVRWDVTEGEDAAWRATGNERFEAAYAPEDSVYEQLAGGV